MVITVEKLRTHSLLTLLLDLLRARLRLVPPVGLSDWQNIISCCELKRSLVTKLCMQVPASANLLSHTDLIETWKVEDLFLGVNVAF
jgi:hypothetical protein